jgi:UDPglucose 6-dehydrogenase
MKIGIVGLGVVGKTLEYCFTRLGYEVVPHDIVLQTSIKDVLVTDICYICVPTPSTLEGECDTSIVLDVVSELNSLHYRGVVAIKSTVEPGTTQKLIEQYDLMRICHVPEFLRERCSISDFMDNHDICVVGTLDEDVFDIVKKTHGFYPKNFIMLNPTQSEILKYFHNIHNATMITLSNVFYEICENFGVNYDDIKTALAKREFISDLYLNCNKNLRGFSGSCLPKDTLAMSNYCKKNNIDIKFFDAIITDNKKFL